MSSTSILPRAPRWRTRAATALAMVGALVSSSGVVLMATASPAQAGPPAPHKVFVCKYVGTSGVDEVLQPSENNPISVDTHALKGVGFTAQHPSTAQFPFSFSDQQGRSVAIAWDETQGDGQSGEPPLGCPPPRGPVEIDPPQQPPVEDPCGPRNIRFKLPDDTDRLDWTLQNNGNVTVAPKPGFTFKGTSQLLTFTLPADSGEACPDEDDEIDVPAQPDVLDPCGPANNAFEARQDTAELDWQLLGNGDLTVKPQDGFVFKGDSQRVTFTLPEDTNEVCPQVDREIAVPASPGVLDPCGPANNAFEARQDTAELDWQLLGNGDLTVTPKAGFVFAGASQLVTFALPADSGRGCPTPTILGVQEIAPTVSFTDPDCAGRDAAWSGTFEDVVDYAVSGDVAPGGSVVVTASVKPSLAGSYGFPVGFDPTSEHSFPSQASLDCVEILGVEKTKAPKPPRAPVALGTTAAVPTAVAAGLGSLPVAGPVPGDLLGRTLTAAGIALLLAAGWLAMGRRERGAREA